MGEIVIIHGCLAGGGESNNAKKAHLRLLQTKDPMEVNTVERPNKSVRSKEVPLIFTEEDKIGVSYPHDDPLVITMVIKISKQGEYWSILETRLIILFLHTFKRLNIGRERLRPMKSSLMGFSGQ